MTQAKDFAENLLKQISALPKDLEIFNPLKRIQSHAICLELTQLLKKLCLSSDVTRQTIEPLLIFLSEIWDDMVNKKIDTIYMHTPHLRANQACTMVALACVQELGASIYHYLTPTLIPYFEKYQCFHLKWHEFILADDGRPIHIYECLNQAEKDKTTDLYHTYGDRKCLNESEKIRVIEHSQYTVRFYDALNFRKIHHHGAAEIEKKELLQALQDEKNYRVKSSYGLKSDEKLALFVVDTHHHQALFHVMVDSIKDRKQWIRFMQWFPKSTWKALLTICHEPMTHFVLDNDVFYSVAQKEMTYQGCDISSKRALIYCLLEIYWQERTGQAEFTGMGGVVINGVGGWLGSYVKSWAGVHSKKEKEMGVSEFQNFLVSDHGAFHDYILSENEKRKMKNEIMLDEDDIVAIISTGELSSLYHHAKEWFVLPTNREKLTIKTMR